MAATHLWGEEMVIPWLNEKERSDFDFTSDQRASLCENGAHFLDPTR